MQNDRELNWDDTIQNDGESVGLIPPGKYQFRVEKIERARYPGGAKIPPCNQANVTVKIFDEMGDIRSVEEKLKLHTSMEWLLCAFFKSIGLRKEGEALQMRWGEVVGKTGWCEISHRSFKGDKGEDVTVTQIKKWLAPDEAPQPATATFTPCEF